LLVEGSEHPSRLVHGTKPLPLLVGGRHVVQSTAEQRVCRTELIVAQRTDHNIVHAFVLSYRAESSGPTAGDTVARRRSDGTSTLRRRPVHGVAAFVTDHRDLHALLLTVHGGVAGERVSFLDLLVSGAAHALHGQSVAVLQHPLD